MGRENTQSATPVTFYVTSYVKYLIVVSLT